MEGASLQVVGSRPGSGMEAVGWSRAEEGGGLMWDLRFPHLKIPSMFAGGTTAEAI